VCPRIATLICLRKGSWTLCAKPKKIYAPASHCAAPDPQARHSVTCQRNCAPFLALSKYPPQKKKQIIIQIKSYKKNKQITPYELPPKKSSKTTTEKAAQRGNFFL